MKEILNGDHLWGEALWKAEGKETLLFILCRPALSESFQCAQIAFILKKMANRHLFHITQITKLQMFKRREEIKY